ncbi:MAG TPA: TolC family protein, partial [Candidatus Angelobacter sp.]|nr:TolC family protein [Candidatus Angelobacter sp.]
MNLDYSAGRKWFPNVIAQYKPVTIPAPPLTNSPRLDQLLQNGKLMLSLQDAISLALENNLAIDVERYTPWLNEVNLLRAQSGVNGLVPFEPTLTGTLNLQDSVTPLNNPLFAGVIPSGSTTPVNQAPAAFVQHVGNVNVQYNQNLPTGTQLQVGMTNNRTASNFGFFNLYNPDVQSALSVIITQPLLRGFGILPNTRLIIEAKRTIKVGLSQLEQQVMATTTQVSNDYWELVYARENVKVEEAALEVSQQLFDENSMRLQIGTLSSLDVLTAQSQLASDKQALVQAQSIQLQDETTLLNDITKDPLAPGLMGVEIVPTTMISTPDTGENVQIADAVKEAWQKRPELKQASLNLENAGTDVKASKNELLPSVNLYGEYIASGLGGIQ